MGATSPGPAAACGERRPRRIPHRLLAAVATVTALAAALLVLGAVGAGRTELRLSAGLQLSFGGGSSGSGGSGSIPYPAAADSAAAAGGEASTRVAEAAGETESAAPAGKPPLPPQPQQQQQQVEQQLLAKQQPPLPLEDPPADLGAGASSSGRGSVAGGGPEGEEGNPDYDNGYGQADILALVGAQPVQSSSSSSDGGRAADSKAAGSGSKPAQAGNKEPAGGPTKLPAGGVKAAGGGAGAGAGGGTKAGPAAAKGGGEAGKPVVAPAASAARESGFACGEALYVKKVALLFLTTRRLAHEKLWRLWLWDAAGLVPHQALPLVQEALCGPASSSEAAWQHIRSACAGTAAALDAAKKGSAAATLLPPQHLFSIYVHAPPDYKGLEYQPLFQGQVIKLRLQTWWGTASITDAERGLLAEALRDPLNDRFVLVSDSDIPLYDPLTVYQQLMHEEKSRVRGCKEGHMNIDRWRDSMATARLKRHHWRKSNQFFGLTRKHAELVMADSEVYRSFKEKCGGWYSSSQQWKECVPDEHYIPTLLASLGLEHETYCGGWGIAWTDWSQNDIHPRSYMPKDVTPQLVRTMRWDCKNAKEAGEDAQRMFLSVPQLLAVGSPQQACQQLREAGGALGNSSSSSSSSGSNSSSSSSGSTSGSLGSSGSTSGRLGSSGSSAAPRYDHPLEGACPLTARKFPPYTALRVRQLFLTSCPGGPQVRSKAAQAFKLPRDPGVALLRGTACAASVQKMSMQQLGPAGAKKRRKRRRKKRKQRRRQR